MDLNLTHSCPITCPNARGDCREQIATTVRNSIWREVAVGVLLINNIVFSLRVENSSEQSAKAAAYRTSLSMGATVPTIVFVNIGFCPLFLIITVPLVKSLKIHSIKIVCSISFEVEWIWIFHNNCGFYFIVNFWKIHGF